MLLYLFNDFLRTSCGHCFQLVRLLIHFISFIYFFSYFADTFWHENWTIYAYIHYFFCFSFNKICIAWCFWYLSPPNIKNKTEGDMTPQIEIILVAIFLHLPLTSIHTKDSYCDFKVVPQARPTKKKIYKTRSALIKSKKKKWANLSRNRKRNTSSNNQFSLPSGTEKLFFLSFFFDYQTSTAND